MKGLLTFCFENAHRMSKSWLAKLLMQTLGFSRENMRCWCWPVSLWSCSFYAGYSMMILCLVLSPLLEVEQLPEMLPVARSWVSELMWWYNVQIKFLKWDYLCGFWSPVIYSKFDVTVVGFSITLLPYCVWSLVSGAPYRMKEISLFLFHWEGNWGKSGELTYSPPYLR